MESVVTTETARTVPSPSRGMGRRILFWLVMTSCSLVAAKIFYAFDQSGVNFVFAAGINSMRLASVMIFCAVLSLLACFWALASFIGRTIKVSWLVLTIRLVVWFVAICLSLYLVLWFLLFAWGGMGRAHVLEDPVGDRKVVLLEGTIYEQRYWPVFVEVGSYETKDGFDPFRAGEFRQSWAERELKLEYAYVEDSTEEYLTEIVEISRSYSG